MKVLDLAAAKQKAYRLLALRSHSEKELEKKLREKGFPAVVIKETLEKLKKKDGNSGFLLEITGPWPPFSFISIKEK